MRRYSWLMLTFLALGMSAPAHAAPLAQVATSIEARVAAIEMSMPAWQDDFETLLVSGFWSEDVTDSSERFFEDGAYQIAVSTADTVAWEMAGDLAYEDVLVAVDTQAVAGSADNEFGIVFRHRDDENFYVYTISSDGYYSLARLVNDEWEKLVAWKRTDAIDQSEGAWNRMELLVESGAISLLVNGELLTTFVDDDSYVGGVGLLAGAYDDEGVQIAFDDFKVWDLQNLIVLKPAATVTRTPEATAAALTARLDAIRAGTPLRHDDFRSNAGVWNSDRGAVSSRFVQNGQFHVRVDAPRMVSWREPQDAEKVGDFLLEVEAAHVSGPLDNEMGVVFRRVGNTFYYFKISSDGYYALSRYDNGQWESLIKWTPSAVLETGAQARNLMGVLASGASLTILANDTVLATVEDPTLASGTFALAAGTNTENGVEVAFDDLTIWQVTQPGSTATPTVKPRSTATPTLIPRSMATPTPTPATPAVAATAISTATPPPPVDVSKLLGTIHNAPPAFSDEFRRTDSGWGTSNTEQASIAYADRALLFQINRENWFIWSPNSHIDELAPANFLLEVDTQHLNGPVNVGFGIVFAYHDLRNYHRFFITQNGYYALQKFAEGVGTNLVTWTQMPALTAAAGGVNRLGLLIQGQEITLLANDQVLARVKDAALTTGTLGLTAATADVPGLDVAFDNVDLWLLDVAAPAIRTPVPTTTP